MRVVKIDYGTSAYAMEHQDSEKVSSKLKMCMSLN